MVQKPNRLKTCCSPCGGWLAAVCIVLVLTGCGRRDGPPRFRLSGTVTHAGKPVPAGSVSFVPDVSKGNNGPSGLAKIKDGHFDTAEGTGHVGGPHIISVAGMDGVATPDLPRGTPLFPSYKISVDLPKEDSTQDIDVPVSRNGKR